MSLLKIIAIKTTIGEEVIAKIKEDNIDHLILEDPRVLMMQQMQDGGIQIGMVPFLVSSTDPENKSESDIKLYKKDIMAEVLNVSSQLEKQYREQVTGIVLV